MIKISYLAPDGGLHKMSCDEVEEIKTFLDEKMTEGGQLFIRLPDDEAMIQVGAHAATGQVKAAGAARMLSGASAPYWHQVQLFVDGEGWRMVLVGMTSHSQAQQPPGPMNGMRRRPG
ncbi:MAG: hypothetical protein ACYDDA_05205 [Acidiferrobacteraceae bacterium]